MPLSPATRILIALTLLAFPWIFVWLDDEGGRKSATMTGVSLSLLVAAVFLLIRDGSAFDDRAFHRTRPGGERRAFRRISVILLGMVVVVSLMPAVRCIYFHLGIRSAMQGAVVAFVPMLLVTAALATGFTLALQRGRSVKVVVVSLIAIPVALCMAPAAVPGLFRFYRFFGPYRPGQWSSELTWWGVVGAAGFCAAWWMAAARQRWLAGLVLAGVTAAGLPVLRTKGAVFRPGEMPVVPVKLIRLPGFTEDPAVGRSAASRDMDEWELKYRRVEGRIIAEGLREDEFVTVGRIIEGRRDLRLGIAHFSGSGRGWSSASWILRTSDSRFDSSRQSLLAHLKGRLPGNPALSGYLWNQDWENVVEIHGSPDVLDLDTLDWNIEGALFRVETLGSFPVSEHGIHRLPRGGVARVWPIQKSLHGIALGFRLIAPHQTDPAVGYRPGYPVWSEPYRTEYQTWMFLVNENQTKAVLLFDRPGYATRAFGSEWRNFNVTLHAPQLANTPHWTPEEILKSRLYLIESRPLGRVQATLPAMK
jgi:hypothetical protein